MSSKKKLCLVLMLSLLAAFAVQAVHAEETAAATPSWAKEAGGLCVSPALGIPEPIPTSCVCVPGGSFNCSGTGSTCSAAEGSFFADCDDEADLTCSGLDGVCFVTIIEQDPCVWNGSQYVVTGRARARCRACS
jgi:hypothetical protein